MKTLFFLVCFFITSLLNAQKFQIKGLVEDDSTHKPLEAANVFLNSTSYGTVTGNDGQFELAGLQGTYYTLIVSFVGYETYTTQISSANSAKPYLILLKPKSNQLDDVIVRASAVDGWNKFGKFFLDNFIGTSTEAKHCRLINRKVVNFYFSKSKNQLDITAGEPLIIENKALGYIIRYQLENFHYDYNTNNLFYSGYPFFSEMKGNRDEIFRWKAARKEVYNLSLMRFIRSVFNNKLIEDGYVVYRLKRHVSNPYKQLLQMKEKLFYENFPEAKKRNAYAATLDGRAHAYYIKIMSQPDTIDMLSNIPLTGDSIAYAQSDTKTFFYFSDNLTVNYVLKKPPSEYRKSHPDDKDSVYSILHLLNDSNVSLYANGSYSNVKNLFFEGFWTWWQRLATILPYDYEPNSLYHD